ncbi:hypothetical protein KO488_13410, partial [Poseidonibacter lekithochrous]|uniref:immunoglobulin-like domain-containing protein n=1 Tax=Poseidonibacter TaxID=2321187 RepID=UPI001C0A1E65
MATVIGKITELNGEFEIVNENGEVVQLVEGQEIQVGDQIQGVVQEINGELQIVTEDGEPIELTDGLTLETIDSIPEQTSAATVTLNNGEQVIVNSQTPLSVDPTVTNNEVNTFDETQIDNETLDNLENDLVDETNLVVENNNDSDTDTQEEDDEIQSDDSKARELDRNADVVDVVADLREAELDLNEEVEEVVIEENQVSFDSVISIDGTTVVFEGNTATYTLNLTQKPSIEVTVTLEYSGVSIDGVDYTSVKTVVIPAGSDQVSFSIDTINDYILDDNEPYIIEIISATGGGYDSLLIDPVKDTVTTTIVDDSKPNTPNDPSDPEEANGLDSVTVKLISTDTSGNEINPATIAEGETSYYKAILVDPSGNQITTATGDVNITFTDGTAIRTGTNADGELDFTGTDATVALNTVFSAVASDDYVADSGETFNVQITDDTYTNASVYENVIHDTTAVITTIVDDSK